MPVDDADGIHRVVKDVFQVFLSPLEFGLGPLAFLDFLFQVLIGLHQFGGAVGDEMFQFIVGPAPRLFRQLPVVFKYLQFGIALPQSSTALRSAALWFCLNQPCHITFAELLIIHHPKWLSA